MKDKVVVFGSHIKADVLNARDGSQPCVLCDQPVYFSKYGGVMANNPSEGVEMPIPDVVFGKECFFDLAANFLNAIKHIKQPRHD